MIIFVYSVIEANEFAKYKTASASLHELGNGNGGQKTSFLAYMTIRLYNHRKDKYHYYEKIFACVEMNTLI